MLENITKKNKRILVVEKSSLHKKIYSLFLRLYDVTLTEDISRVSKEYDLIILSGEAFCDERIDHPCILRYHPMKRNGDSGNYLFMPLTEEKVQESVRKLLQKQEASRNDFIQTIKSGIEYENGMEENIISGRDPINSEYLSATRECYEKINDLLSKFHEGDELFEKIILCFKELHSKKHYHGVGLMAALETAEIYIHEKSEKYRNVPIKGFF